ncbi:hypothetical protein [Alistipes sp.]|uniref:hypothetical protein n=1 Tax=Alistipes sp. TaxID=1872444 RepID=UPI0025BDACAA|nr:hypothetical protein [Alistipes sp.]
MLSKDTKKKGDCKTELHPEREYFPLRPRSGPVQAVKSGRQPVIFSTMRPAGQGASRVPDFLPDDPSEDLRRAFRRCRATLPGAVGLSGKNNKYFL